MSRDGAQKQDLNANNPTVYKHFRFLDGVPYKASKRCYRQNNNFISFYPCIQGNGQTVFSFLGKLTWFLFNNGGIEKQA